MEKRSSSTIPPGLSSDRNRLLVERGGPIDHVPALLDRTSTGFLKAERQNALPRGRESVQIYSVCQSIRRTVVILTENWIQVTYLPLPQESEVGVPGGIRTLRQVMIQRERGDTGDSGRQADPAAARPGLVLGARMGTLPDGARVWDLHCAPDVCSPSRPRWTNDLRRIRGHLVPSMSGKLSVNHPKTLAANVALR